MNDERDINTEEYKPHTCPVCYGKGIVDVGFYLTPGQVWSVSNATPEICKSCDGKGVIWETIKTGE